MLGVARLVGWLETMRGAGGYGGPVVHLVATKFALHRAGP